MSLKKCPKHDIKQTCHVPCCLKDDQRVIQLIYLRDLSHFSRQKRSKWMEKHITKYYLTFREISFLFWLRKQFYWALLSAKNGNDLQKRYETRNILGNFICFKNLDLLIVYDCFLCNNK